MTTPSKTYSTPAGFTLAPDENCLTLVIKQCTENPDKVMFSRPEGHDWVEVTGREFMEQFRAVAKGLVANGIEFGYRVGPVSYTHLTLPTIAAECRSRWSPYH